MVPKRRRKVEWVGGPFDGETFRVPEGQKHIKVGTTQFQLNLDDEEGVQAVKRDEIKLPIVRRGLRSYVVWKELGQ